MQLDDALVGAVGAGPQTGRLERQPLLGEVGAEAGPVGHGGVAVVAAPDQVVDESVGVMDQLLKLAADWKTSDVIIAPPSLLWLYHPYDGGADVIAPSSTARSELVAKHGAWLSSHLEWL